MAETDLAGTLDQETQAKLAKAFRRAQVGQCVNSVAHDLNNFLGAIMAYSELVGMDPALSDETKHMASEIMAAVRKASGLVSEVTTIARKERRDVRLMRMDQLFERVLLIRGYDFKVAQIALEEDYDAKAPSVAVDIPKLEMALIYLITNTIEAIGEETRPRRAKLGVRSGPDDTVELSVWDSGPGIPEELGERAFEPFVTSKGGDHLGLGLWVARETARLHDGDLTYHPERGMVIRLPLRSALNSSM